MLILQSMVIPSFKCLKNSSNWTNFSQNFAPIMEKEVRSELWKSKRFWMFSLFVQGNHDFPAKVLIRILNNFWVIYVCWEEKFVSAIEISFFNNFYWKKTDKGPFNNYVNKMRGSKNVCFCPRICWMTLNTEQDSSRIPIAIPLRKRSNFAILGFTI